MAQGLEKPSFSKFIKNIAEETLGQQLGYVDPEKTTQLILHREPEQIITCIQENAVCSPETLGKNLGLRPLQVSQVIEAHTGNRGLQIRHVICCWIEANQSKATVRVLLEGLWHIDDTKALTCVQDLEVIQSIDVQTSRRKEDLNATEEVYASTLDQPLGSQYNMPPPFQRADSQDHRAVVAMPNGTLTQLYNEAILKARSLHKDGSTDSATEESVQGTRLSTVSTVPATYTRAVLPTFLLPPKAKSEELPSDLPFQQPHEATQSPVPLTDSEIFAVSETCSTKPPQRPDVKPEELPLELTLQQPHEATQSSVLSTETEFVAASEIRSMKPCQESVGEIKHKETDMEARVVVLEKKSTDSEMRFKKLEEEIRELKSTLKYKDKKIKELEGDVNRLCTEKQEIENQLEELKVKKEDELEELKVKKEDEIRDKAMEIKKLKAEIQELRSELKDKDQEHEKLKPSVQDSLVPRLCPPAFYRTVRGCIQETDGEGGHIEEQPTEYEDVDTAQPRSRSAPDEDSRPDSYEDIDPKMWILGERLGKGSFGEVYIYRHKVNTTEVLAVKVIDVETCGNDSVKLASFTKEVLALKQVPKHNRIVQYAGIDVDVATKGAIRLHIFMEYIPGGTLRQYIQKHGRMELPLVRKYTVQLLEGVAHLHENKIVHRDIKGANILLDSEGNIKLADFGCAKSLENIDIDGKMSHEQGTIYWRPPEAVETSSGSLHYVFESDIWSVGATVMELITGKHPYHPKNIYTVIWILGSEEPTFQTPYDVCKIPEPDPHMVTFLSHCFQRKHSERWSAQKLLQKAEFCCIK